MGDIKSESKPLSKARVKLNVEHEEIEAESGRKKMKRFTLPTDLSRWWQAKIIRYAFSHPHVRARLEKHMGTNLVKLTDKVYMSDLEERIHEVVQEHLNKRISARVLDEMERLKRLILVGKTPLKECPPELYHHPVFVFWRMVNREVAKACKKRADAYYRKLKSSQKTDHFFEEEVENEEEAEELETLTPEQLLEKAAIEIEQQKLADIELGVRFDEDTYAMVKYEAPEVKMLKTMTTVDELYNLADRIIGTKRLANN